MCGIPRTHLGDNGLELEASCKVLLQGDLIEGLLGDDGVLTSSVAGGCVLVGR